MLPFAGPPLRKIRIKLPPEHAVIRRSKDLNNREDDGQRQHGAERVTPRRKSVEDGARSKDNKEHGPYELKRPTHSQHVAEKEEMTDCEDESYSEPFIEASNQDR